MKVIKYIPDCITLMNLLCGTLASIAALHGSFFTAFALILAAAVFDFADGFAARLLGAYSDLGKELDSLSDLVSFALAPSLMTYQWLDARWGNEYSILPFIALVPVLSAALRLARFNTDSRQKVDFIGLPVPGMAMVIAPAMAFAQYSVTANCGCSTFLAELLSTKWFIPLVAVIMSILMVSSVPMFSMKHKTLSFREFPKGVIFFALFGATFAAYTVYGLVSPLGADFIHGAFPLTISTGFTIYILINLVSRHKTT